VLKELTSRDPTTDSAPADGDRIESVTIEEV
jgi:hypothetical protein